MSKIIGAGEICRRMLLSEATVMGMIQSGLLPAEKNKNNEWETTDHDLANARAVYTTRKKPRRKAPSRRPANPSAAAKG